MNGFLGPTPSAARGLCFSRRRASSLVELLVVVATITLLAGMLLPSLKRSMLLASSAVCKHNLRQIDYSLRMYRYDNDGWLPTVGNQHSAGIASGGGGGSGAWFQQLLPTYLHDPMILTCPDDPYRYRMAAARDRPDHPQIADFASYGLNGFMMFGGKGQLANLDRFRPTRPLDTILLADLGPDYSAKPAGAPQWSGPKRHDSVLSVADGFDLFSGTSASWLTLRHGDGMNVVTLGGGVRPAATTKALRVPVEVRYDDCAAGGCTVCRSQAVYHYSFAQDRLYWWTGPAPGFNRIRIGN